jgi:hypothetical protein
MTEAMKTAPKMLIFGDSEIKRINGIDFYRSAHMPDTSRPDRVRRVHRIGNAKVPAWLYELMLAMALERQAAARPLNVSVRGMTFVRHADGHISAELETQGDVIPDDKIAEVFLLALGKQP